jgi:hypothetical protein
MLLHRRGLGQFAEALGEELLEFFEGLRETFDAFLQLVVSHLVFGMHLVEGGLVDGDLFDGVVLRGAWVELADENAFGGLQLFQQLGRDGEQVAAAELDDLAGVAEAGAHDDRLVAELLVVVIDLGDGFDARVLRAAIVLAGAGLVPIENATDEWRDKGDLGFGAGYGLVEAEEQRHVAVDAFGFEDLRGLDAFPCGGELDEDALVADAGFVVLLDDVARCGEGSFGVVAEACVDFGGDATGNDVENLTAEGYGESLEGSGGDFFIVGVGVLLAGSLEYVVDDGLVLGHAGSSGDERGVGGRVGGLVLLDGVDVTGIRHDGGHRFELI